MDKHIVVKAKVRTDNGLPFELSVIVTSDGILKSHLDYLLKHRAKSESWRAASIRAVGMLVDYMSANQGVFDTPQKMFEEFAHSVFSGTIDENGNDPSELRWIQREIPNGNTIIGNVTRFSDWLAEKNEKESLKLNPFRKADTYEKRLNWAAYCHRHDNAFLAHLWSIDDAKRDNALSRNVRNREELKTHDIVYAFPENKFFELIKVGFVKARSEHLTLKKTESLFESRDFLLSLELRDVLITLLLHYGGLRESEPFHIWIDDIMSYPDDTSSALIKIHHPEYGKSPECYDSQRPIRKHLLMRDFGLKPRNKNRLSERIRAGWKSNVLDNQNDRYMYVNWFPTAAGRWFKILWDLYLKYQYVTPNEPHPFAFTSETGAPYSVKAFIEKHKSAVQRIGLKYKYEFGTPPHCHRHSYGYRLHNADFPLSKIKKYMHHASETSSEVYTRETLTQMRDKLQEASEKLDPNLKQTDEMNKLFSSLS